jgi:N-methylhydantoinase B/oxoprolinase/acetone carboxylase alpha subunit
MASPGAQAGPAALDDFELEILRNYFVATVREMVTVTARAAYSTLFSEGYDFSCAVFDREGRMYAQEGGLAVHLGGLADVLVAVYEQYPKVRPGDVFIHNDPLNGGSHQADISVVMPVFIDGTFMGSAVRAGRRACGSP